MTIPTNPDGSLLGYSAEQVGAMNIRTHKIRDGSHPTHRREFNASTIRACYLIAGDQLENFVGYMLGGSVAFVGGDGVTRISRLMPQTWPGLNQFACVAVDNADGIKFLGDDDSGPFPVPMYKHFRVDLTFQHVPFQLVADQPGGNDELGRYVQHLPSETTSDYISLPGGVMKLITTAGAAPPGAIGGNLPPVNHNIGVPIPTQIIRRKWLRVPYLEWGAPGGAPSVLYERVFGNPATNTRGWIGTTNSDSLMGFQPGQLLYLGADEEEQLDPLGYRVWNLTHKWAVKSQGQNFFLFYPSAAGAGTIATWCFATNDGTYYPPTALPDGKSVFDSRQHRLLWAVGDAL